MTARRLVLATRNPGKIVEIERMLVDAGIDDLEVVSVAMLGEPPPIDETAADFAGNARLKAVGIARWLAETRLGARELVLADDSGLCVDALAGAPGVHSARFAGPAASDADNNEKLVAELRARALSCSRAHYEAVLALAAVDGPPLLAAHAAGVEVEDGVLFFRGRCEGEVCVEARGSGGFGYDPHFWIDGRSCTFAELAVDAKARRSHRGEAMRALVAALAAGWAP